MRIIALLLQTSDRQVGSMPMAPFRGTTAGIVDGVTADLLCFSRPGSTVGEAVKGSLPSVRRKIIAESIGANGPIITKQASVRKITLPQTTDSSVGPVLTAPLYGEAGVAGGFADNPDCGVLSGLILVEALEESQRPLMQANTFFRGSSTAKNPHRGKLSLIDDGCGLGTDVPKTSCSLSFTEEKGSERKSQVLYLFAGWSKSSVFRGKFRISAGSILRPFLGSSLAFRRPQPHFLSLRVLWALSCSSHFTTLPRATQARRSP